MKVFIKKRSLKTFFLVAGVFLVVGLLMVLMLSGGSGTTAQASGESIITENGKQVLLMNARVGYTPNSFNAKAGTDSILRISTNNTFDCSSSVVIPALNISKTLPTTGTTDIALGTQKAGTTISGSCGMGMYKFKIKFS
jgi:plastocyanin domain-containing protein